MSINEAIDVIDKISYQPVGTLKVITSFHRQVASAVDGLELRIMDLFHVAPGERTVAPKYMRQIVSPDHLKRMTERDLVNIVYNMVRVFEMAKVDEYFQYNKIQWKKEK